MPTVTIRVLPIPDAPTEKAFVIQASRIWRQIHSKTNSNDCPAPIYLPSSLIGDKRSRYNFDLFQLPHPQAYTILPGWEGDSIDYRPEKGWLLVLEHAGTWTKPITVQLAHIVLIRGVSLNEAEKAARQAIRYLVKGSGGQRPKGKRPGITVPQRQILEELFAEEFGMATGQQQRGTIQKKCLKIEERLLREGMKLSLPTIKKECEQWRRKQGHPVRRTRFYMTSRLDVR